MKSYKSIKYYENERLDFSGDSNYDDFPYIYVDNSFDFGIIQINENFIVTNLLDRLVNIVVSKNQVDNFLCVFLKNRIVLTEKKRNMNRLLDLIQKQYWTDTVLITHEADEPLQDVIHFIFERVESNIITMNNNTQPIVIPFFDRS